MGRHLNIGIEIGIGVKMPNFDSDAKRNYEPWVKQLLGVWQFEEPGPLWPVTLQAPKTASSGLSSTCFTSGFE